ncbi:MAG: hypothetical protein KDB14_30025 [Planctomycetales bacterium]|nr:hypothetical protein [Planctomycetales bacterium]
MKLKKEFVEKEVELEQALTTSLKELLNADQLRRLSEALIRSREWEAMAHPLAAEYLGLSVEQRTDLRNASKSHAQIIQRVLIRERYAEAREAEDLDRVQAIKKIAAAETLKHSASLLEICTTEQATAIYRNWGVMAQAQTINEYLESQSEAFRNAANRAMERRKQKEDDARKKRQPN